VPPSGAPLDAVLGALPLLFKSDVRSTLPKQWVPEGCDAKAELGSGALELVETSGSTGERLRVLWDRGWWMRQERRGMRTNPVIAAAMDGREREYREAILTSPACGLGTCHIGDRPYEERVDGPLLFLNQRPDPLFWTADEQNRMLDEIARHRTVGLESDPFYLATLARFADSRSRRLEINGFVQLTYALATRAHFRAIARAFSGPVRQLYGASEVGVVFMEGEDGRLHHCPFTTHVELLPARVPTPGAEGVALVVATTLDRAAMPLVRFVLGDLVQVDPSAGPVWTSVPPLRSVEGRLDDALVRPDGALVTAGALDRALARVPGILLWQANQRAPGSVEIDFVPDESCATGSSIEEARAALAPLLAGLDVHARTAAAIPIEPSGKFRVSKRHFPLDATPLFGSERAGAA
jgi:phenylacetate-CoA ligase